MICQTPNDDPCSRVTSPAEAVEYAEALLITSARPGCEFWAAAAVGPLAGMLYAASPRGNNEGVGWLVRAAAANTDEASGDSARCARHGAGVVGDSAIAVSGRPASTEQRAADARSSSTRASGTAS